MTSPDDAAELRSLLLDSAPPPDPAVAESMFAATFSAGPGDGAALIPADVFLDAVPADPGATTGSDLPADPAGAPDPSGGPAPDTDGGWGAPDDPYEPGGDPAGGADHPADGHGDTGGHGDTDGAPEPGDGGPDDLGWGAW